MSISPPTDGRRPGRWRRLNAAALVLWRGPDVVQFELGDNRIMVSNVDPREVAALIRPSAARLAVEPSPPQLANRLHEAGFLTRQAPAGAADVPAYLSADLGALVGRYGDDAVPRLARRRQAIVTVQGTSRISATIATTLAAAGVGHVHLVGGTEASAADSCPGGILPSDEGARFGTAGSAAIKRSAPTVHTGPVPAGGTPDLVILTDPLPIDPAVRAGLHLDGRAHLSVAVDGSRAVVGPLVIPGRTSCLRCADLTRNEHDPSWPLLAIQLSARPRHRGISDVALCVAAAGAAAGQALEFLDGQHVQTCGGTMEWQLPDWRLRRRSWLPHHECDCGAAGRSSEHGTMDS